jgi:chromosome segregation protein
VATRQRHGRPDRPDQRSTPRHLLELFLTGGLGLALILGSGLSEELQRQRQELARQQGDLRQQQGQLAAPDDDAALEQAETNCRSAEAAVELSRRRLGEVAGRSGSWLEEQKQRSRRRHELQSQLSPLQAEQQQWSERLRQEQERLSELQLQLQEDAASSDGMSSSLSQLEGEWQQLLHTLQREQTRAQELVEALALQQRTRQRLEQEQGTLEREIARLESRRETLQESRGTGALRLLLEAGLEGIHGPVAQLAEVEERHRLALEVAAGARLGQVVVDDDRIAARAIDLLKSRRAGRLTFLPLNKIRGNGSGGGSDAAALQRGSGAGADGLVLLSAGAGGCAVCWCAAGTVFVLYFESFVNTCTAFLV